MAAPTNITPGTAVDITSLPYSVTQTVDDAGTTYDVYYQHTPASDGLLSVFGFGDLTTYQPKVSVFVGVGATPYLIALAGPNLAIQVPVTASTTYWFKFITNAGNPSPATLTLAVKLFAQQTAPEGSILVNDDTPGFPLLILSPTTGQPVQFVQPFPAGEACDILDNGIMLFSDVDPSPNDLQLYDANFTNIATLNGYTAASQFGTIRTCVGTQRFWVAYRVAGPFRRVRYITDDGTEGTIHDLTAIPSLGAIAASNDESVLYHTEDATNAPIAQWDLLTDTAGSDLVAGRASYQTPDILVLGDDSVVVLYVKTSATIDVEVIRYDASGATLDTYNFGSAHDFPAGTLPRLAYGDDETSFWIWTHPDGADLGTSQFQEVRVSDGAILTDVSAREFETGVYNGTATATPDAYFGNSFSCPFLITRTSIQPEPPSNLNGPAALAQFETDGTMRDYRIVWSRRAPHLADEAQRVFYSNFQLDMETGVGIVDGQGITPTCELRWSNDGGFTWSGWAQLSMGALGQYRVRARHPGSLGQARDRVFEVRGSDPVKVALLQAYLDVQEGLN